MYMKKTAHAGWKKKTNVETRVLLRQKKKMKEHVTTFTYNVKDIHVTYQKCWKTKGAQLVIKHFQQNYSDLKAINASISIIPLYLSCNSFFFLFRENRFSNNQYSKIV